VGREAALAKLRELAGTSTNQFFAMHLPTKEICSEDGGDEENINGIRRAEREKRRPSHDLAGQPAPELYSGLGQRVLEQLTEGAARPLHFLSARGMYWSDSFHGGIASFGGPIGSGLFFAMI
jgi:hypothetical protein